MSRMRPCRRCCWPDLPDDLAAADLGRCRRVRVRPTLLRAGRVAGGMINAYGPTETTVLRDHERGAWRARSSSDRPSDLEHAGLCFGRWSGACACWCERGALHCGVWSCAGLCGPCGSDGGAVCCGPVWCCGEPDVPHRRPCALARRRGAGVPGACGCAGEGARLPDRAWARSRRRWLGMGLLRRLR